MKLYELERGSKFKLAGENLSPTYILDHLDGMYSVCYLDGKEALGVVHLAGFTPIIKIKENTNG